MPGDLDRICSAWWTPAPGCLCRGFRLTEQALPNGVFAVFEGHHRWVRRDPSGQPRTRPCAARPGRVQPGPLLGEHLNRHPAVHPTPRWLCRRRARRHGRIRPGRGPTPRADQMPGGAADAAHAAALRWLRVQGRYRHAACPDTVVSSDQPALVADFDPRQVSCHVDEPADDCRVNGVVVAVDADVVVASQPDSVDPPDRPVRRVAGEHRGRSASSRSTGRALIVRTTRVFALVSQSANWASKSAGDAKSLPGMKEVSKNPLRRSTMPFDSGS